MTPLHRHQVAWLSRAGWERLLAAPWDDEARPCLKHWAGHRLPLVVTRQPESLGEGQVALGLSAPARWGHRRLALRLPRAEVAYFDEFPLLERIAPQLPATVRTGVRGLARALHGEGIVARAYGSHGWQALTGLEHVRAGSDLDMWLGVSGSEQADAAVARLSTWTGAVRLDGELVFPGDTAVAWREWQAWREGRTGVLLVKRLHGAGLLRSGAVFDPLPVAA